MQRTKSNHQRTRRRKSRPAAIRLRWRWRKATMANARRDPTILSLDKKQRRPMQQKVVFARQVRAAISGIASLLPRLSGMRQRPASPGRNHRAATADWCLKTAARSILLLSQECARFQEVFLVINRPLLGMAVFRFRAFLFVRGPIPLDRVGRNAGSPESTAD